MDTDTFKFLRDVAGMVCGMRIILRAGGSIHVADFNKKFNEGDRYTKAVNDTVEFFKRHPHFVGDESDAMKEIIADDYRYKCN